ncbi:MAG: D-alanyl-D-alanine carboxypeptidase [Oscillospiraceae bacterium]|nr:D-alanyl-D-alanine carboxypeptidase [Oscillospiraceae bacterium]
MKKISVLIAVIMLYTVLMPLNIKPKAITFTPNFTVNSEVAVLINLDKDIVVYEKNPTKKVYPASLTKIMTAMVVLDNVKDLDNTKYEAPLAVFDDLYGKGASAIGYSRGEIATANDLMYSMLIYSACESAGILAYHVGGESIPNFVSMMNEKAKEIGCTGTNFANPHGLHDPDQYTNARDMALIAQYAVENYPKLVDIACTQKYTMKATNYQQDGWATVYHTNKMLSTGSDYYYEYSRGLKTGTLDESGRNLVAMARKDGNNYLLVTMGAPMTDAEGNKTNGQYEDHKNIFEWAFNNFSYEKIVSQSQEVTEIPVLLGQDADHVLLVPSEEFSTLWPSTLDKSTLKVEIDTSGYTDETGSVLAPISKGQKLGTYTLSLSGEVLCTLDLVAKEGVELSQLEYNKMKAKAFIGSFWFKLAAVIAGILTVAYIAIILIYNRKKKRRMKKVKKNRKF